MDVCAKYVFARAICNAPKVGDASKEVLANNVVLSASVLRQQLEHTNTATRVYVDVMRSDAVTDTPLASAVVLQIGKEL